MNETVQAILLLSGPAGAAIVWWVKRGDDTKLRGRVDECEHDRASLYAKIEIINRELDIQRGSVATLTALLKQEINIV